LKLPVPGPIPRWSPPAPGRRELLGGRAVLYSHTDHGLPLVSVRVHVPVGSADDPEGAWGTAALAIAMANESAGDRTSLERAAAFDRLAARFLAQAGREWTTFGVDVHRDRLLPALDLLADSLLRPQMIADDWARVHERHVTGIEQSLDDNNVVASILAPRLLLGDGHACAHPVDGTVATAEAITRESAAAFYADRVARGPIAVVLVGDIDADAVAARLEAILAPWPDRPANARPPMPPAGPPKRYFVDRPESTQTVIRWLAPADAPETDRWPLELARVVLGGSFTSRLNQRLREEKGYTYGARLGVVRLGRTGVVSAGASVRADATGHAVADVLDVLGKARDGFTEAERERAIAQALSDLVDAAESRAALAAAYGGELESGRDPRAVATFADALAGVSLSAMHAVTQRWLDPEHGAIVLVGDAASALPQLEAVGIDGFEPADV
jgi:zinc protease